MFFLVIILFIIQIILMIAIVSFLLNMNVKILMLTDAVDLCNKWLTTRSSSIVGIFSDLKMLTEKYKNRFEKTKRNFMIRQSIGLIEWALLLIAKPRGKQFVLGYKIAKAVLKELSTSKNMV